MADTAARQSQPSAAGRERERAPVAQHSPGEAGPQGSGMAPPASGIEWLDRRRSAAGGSADGAPPAAGGVGLPGPGRPLADTERRRFEGPAGMSLAAVRVHEGAAAQASAAALNARAWASGAHVVLGAGVGPANRDAVLAHELAHVVAQRAAPTAPGPVGAAGVAAEAAAERGAANLLWGRPAAMPHDIAGIVRRLPPGRDGDPLVITATSLRDAADQMRAILDELHAPDRHRLVIVGASGGEVYDRAGTLLGRFRLAVPSIASTGVHVHTNPETPLFRLERHGGDYRPGARSGGTMNFSQDIEDQPAFNELLRGYIPMYVVPAAARAPRERGPAPEPEPDELMSVSGPRVANAPAWRGAVVPMTPQVTGTDTIGSFLMRVENNQGYSTLDRVTNLMQPIAYRWEVLKLDAGFRAMAGARRDATRLAAARAYFERRGRDLAADRRTRLGEHPERQGVPERVIRAAIDDQIARPRAILGYTGETVMTVIRALTGSPDNPFSEDIIDVPFGQPGDYFVRCLATPITDSSAAVRRATTVAGVTVSVFDIGEFTADALGTDADDERRARERVEAIDSELAAAPDTSDSSAGAVARRQRDRAFLGFERAYREAVPAAHGDQGALLAAERRWVQARIAWFSAPDAPAGDAVYAASAATELQRLRDEESRLATLIERAGTRLGGDMSATGTMRALLVDEAVGGRSELRFAFGERTYVADRRTEVEIVDITAAEGGRRFNGMADGWGDAARAEALRAAMRDLRANLHRGRGYLAYRLPPAYRAIDLDLPNPMQLQMGVLDQAVETIDDAAHAMTLAAVVAAPFTGGASLSVLGVLAPIQAGTSLYRIVERSAYGDLALDAQSISDFINVASFGLGHTGSVSRFASRGVQIVAGAQRVAVLLLDAGNYIVMGWQAFRDLTAEVPGEDPRAGRQRRLLALLTAMEGAGIPVAGHLWPPGGHGSGPVVAPHGGEGTPPPHADRPATPGEAHPPPHGSDGSPARRDAPPDAAHLATPDAGASRQSDHPELRRGLPGDLAGLLPIVRDTSADFGRTTVRVEYVTDARGVITEISLRVGRDASFRHIAEHVATVRTMQRYQGLSGRVRVVLERIGAWLRLHPEAGPGTRAWEARLEVDKLSSIIEARTRALVDPATPASRRDEIANEIRDLESQLADHQSALDAWTTDPGRGFVAAEGRSGSEAEAARRNYPRLPDPALSATDGTPLGSYIWRFRNGSMEVFNRGDGPKLLYDETTRRFSPDTGVRAADPPFLAGTNRRAAYDLLGGREPGSEFGQFTRMLLDEGLAADHLALERMLQDPSGVTPRTVRHNFKQQFEARLIEHLMDPVRLMATPAYTTLRRGGRSHLDALAAASHSEMVRVTRLLHESDRGSVAERWYERQFGMAGVETPTQVRVSVADAGAAGATISTDRRLDRVSGSMIEEIKNVRTRMGEAQRMEINDQLALVGHEIAVGGAPRHIDMVKVSMLDPEGVLANASYMHERLAPTADHADALIFELHSANGQVLMVTTDNRAILANPAALTRWVRTGRTP